ncbi:unnamed protein product [Ectocarpus sp. 12 AP-2014]
MAIGATTTLRSCSPSVSPRPSGGTTRVGCVRGGGGRSAPAAGETAPANPLQATFLNRVCLLDIDDKHKATLHRRWKATRTWSWGYEKQRRCNKAAEDRVNEERKSRRAREEAERVTADQDAARTAAAAAAALKTKTEPLEHLPHQGQTPAAPISLSAQRSMQRPGGGEVSPGRRGIGSGSSAFRRSSTWMWPRRQSSGTPGERNDGESPQQQLDKGPDRLIGGRDRGPQMTGTIRPPGGMFDPVRRSTPAAEARDLRPKGSASVGQSIKTEAAGASITASAADIELPDVGQVQQVESKEVFVPADREVEAPRSVDWAHDIWSQCRLHRISTSPLLLPMASSTLSGFAVKASATGDDDGGQAEAEAAFLDRMGLSQGFGPVGRDYTSGEGQPGSARGNSGTGSIFLGNVSETEWGASSYNYNSLGMPQHTGSVVGEASVREPSGDRQLRQSSEEEETDVQRSRSATSSGIGRESTHSAVGSDERWAVAATPTLGTQPGMHRGSFLRGLGSGGTVARDGESDAVGAAELRQTRSVSLAGIGLGCDGGSAGGGTGGPAPSSFRRKSSAVDRPVLEAASTPEPAIASTSGTGEHVAVDSSGRDDVEAEPGATLARQFVLAYSSYLVESLGFVPVTEEATIVSADNANTDTDVKCRTRSMFAGHPVTFASGLTVGATGSGKAPMGVRGLSVNDQLCSPATLGSGGVLLAHALLRLPLELTNTVALVEVSVMVAPRTSTAAAAGRPRQPMQASVKFWTLDVMEPPGGWEGDGPIGSSVEGQGASKSWWANLPTLSSFKWNLDPNNPTFHGTELPDELPNEMYRVIHKLRLRNAVEDFLVGQVEAALLSSAATDLETAADAPPKEQLRFLFALNAHGILSRMAAENDAAYFEGSRPCDNDDPPAVTREVISIELDAERGPLLSEASPSPRRPSAVRSAPASPGPVVVAPALALRGGEDATTPARGKDAATPTSAGSRATPIRAPIPRRQHRESPYLDGSRPQEQHQQHPQEYDQGHGHERAHLHPSDSRSPISPTPLGGRERSGMTIGGGAGGIGGTGGGHGGGEEEDDTEAEVDAETKRFMWHLYRNAELYGLTSQPTLQPATRPILSGTIMARELTVGSSSTSTGIYGDDGRAVVDNSAERGEEGGMRERAAGAKRTKPETFPVCTFVLTTLEDHDKGATRRAKSSGNGDDRAAAAVDGSLDVVLFVIEGARPMSCRSWEGEGTATTSVSGRDWWNDGPFPEDIAQQASQLVERLLRLAIAKRRKDTAWELFNQDNPWWPLYKNAMVLPSRREERTSSPAPQAVPPLPDSWHPPLALLSPPPQVAAGASSRHHETPFLRAPSPALSFTSIGTGFSLSGYENVGLDEGSFLPPVSELNLRDLLEVSVVTPLGVALPTLRGIIDPRHGVDWGRWFQHLADSPAFRTIVFEDWDGVLAPAAAPSGCAFNAASAAVEEEEGAIGGEGAIPRTSTRTRCALLALPMLPARESGVEEAGDHNVSGGGGGDGGGEGGSGSGSGSGSGGGRGGGSGAVKEDTRGVGPWVGSSNAIADELSRESGSLPQAASLLFCVILHKESNTVDVDIVQREKIARLTKWERVAVSAFADDMLDWCTNDILRTTQEALCWTDEEEMYYC